MTVATRIGVATLLIGGLLGCESDATAPAECSASTADVTLTITPGTSPTFSWAPSCPAFLFLVEERDSGHDEWWIVDNSSDTTTASNTIMSPLSYGLQPSGTNQNPDGPLPLQAGTTYTVAVWSVMTSAEAASHCEGQVGNLCLLDVKFITP